MPNQDLTRYLDGLNASQTAKADTWEAFHSSKDIDEFTQHLNRLSIPSTAKADLWELKKKSLIPVAPTTPQDTGSFMDDDHIGGKAVTVLDWLYEGSGLGDANRSFDKMAEYGGTALKAMNQPGVVSPLNPLGSKPNVSPQIQGISDAASKLVGSTVADPRQLALMGGGLSSVIARRLMAAGFAGVGAKGAIEQAGELGSKYDTLDTAGKYELGTEAVLNTAMAALAGGHAVTPTPKLPSAPRTATLEDFTSKFDPDKPEVLGSTNQVPGSEKLPGDLRYSDFDAMLGNLRGEKPLSNTREVGGAMPKSEAPFSRVVRNGLSASNTGAAILGGSRTTPEVLLNQADTPISRQNAAGTVVAPAMTPEVIPPEKTRQSAPERDYGASGEQVAPAENGLVTRDSSAGMSPEALNRQGNFYIADKSGKLTTFLGKDRDAGLRAGVPTGKRIVQVFEDNTFLLHEGDPAIDASTIQRSTALMPKDSSTATTPSAIGETPYEIPRDLAWHELTHEEQQRFKNAPDVQAKQAVIAGARERLATNPPNVHDIVNETMNKAANEEQARIFMDYAMNHGKAAPEITSGQKPPVKGTELKSEVPPVSGASGKSKEAYHWTDLDSFQRILDSHNILEAGSATTDPNYLFRKSEELHVGIVLKADAIKTSKAPKTVPWQESEILFNEDVDLTDTSKVDRLVVRSEADKAKVHQMLNEHFGDPNFFEIQVMKADPAKVLDNLAKVKAVDPKVALENVRAAVQSLESGEKATEKGTAQLETLTGRTLPREGTFNKERYGTLEKHIAHELRGWLNEQSLKEGLAKLKSKRGALPPDENGGGEGTLNVHLNVLRPVTEAYTRLIGEPLWNGLRDGFLKGLDLLIGEKGVRWAIDPHYKTPAEFVDKLHQTKTEALLTAERGLALGKRLTKGLNQAKQQMLGKLLRGEITQAEWNVMHQDPKMADAIEAAKLARHELNTLGAQAVVQRLLKEETFVKNFGRYLPELYRKYEVPYEENLKYYGQSKPSRLEYDRFRKREDIPDEVKLLMGAIREPGYPVAKGIAGVGHDIAFSKLYDWVAQHKEWTLPADVQGKDLSNHVLMPETPKLGALSGKYVEKHIADEINATIKAHSEVMTALSAINSEWKFGKVVLNPATWFRNAYSNVMLNHLAGLPFTRVDIYAKAFMELKNEGQFYTEAKQEGLINSTYSRHELGILIDAWEQTDGGLATRLARMGEILRKDTAKGILGNVTEAVAKFRPSKTKLGQGLGHGYQTVESMFKVAKYIHNREKGMTTRNAALDAESTLFNYGDVPPMVEVLRRSPVGAPFMTFTFKAVPKVLESVVKTPWRIATLGYMLNMLNDYGRKTIGMSEEDEKKFRANLPPRLQGNKTGIPNHIILPVKDRYGQVQMLDTTYMLPWGDVVESGGANTSTLTPIMASMARPFVEVGLNKSAYTEQEIVKSTDTPQEAARKRFSYVYRQLVPSMMPGNPDPNGMPPAGFSFSQLANSAMGKQDYMGRQKSPISAISSTIFGLKVNPVDPETEARRRLFERKATDVGLQKDIFGVQRNQGLSPEEKQERIKDIQQKRRQLRQPSK